MDGNNRVIIFTDMLAKGGVGRIVSYLMNYLSGDFDKYLLLFDRNRIDFSFQGEILDLEEVPPPYSNMLKECFILFKCLIKTLKFKKRLRPSICISFKEGPNFINVLSGHCRVIVSVREHKSKGIRFRSVFMCALVKWVIKKIYNRAHSVVCVSNVIGEDLIENFGIQRERIRVIHNPVNLEIIQKKWKEPLNIKYESIFNSDVIVTAGRLEREKGYWHLIRAFGKVREYRNSVRLVIIGEGTEKDYLKKIVNKLGLQEDVIFLGYKLNPFKYIARSKIFVLSSLWEGFPNVLLEAMACRIPVISADCRSGPREILAPETDPDFQTQKVEYAEYGILIPVQDGEYKSAEDRITSGEVTLANVIMKVLVAPGLREKYANMGYKRCMHFSMELFVRQWRDVIKECDHSTA